MAEALQDAHEAGVIHRDVKPSNILVSQPSTPDSQLLAKLTDFGIGQVMSQEVLAGMTRLGFTQTMMTSGSQSGSQMYMAPELLAGQPASPRSDLYSLGVVLYQLLAGDFARPVTTDWAKAIEDPLLREDLQQCFAGDVRERFGSAGQLAVNLRSLAQRRVKRAAEQAAIAARERAAYRRGLVRATAVGAAIVAVMAGLLIFAVRQTKVANQERDRARTAEEKAEEEKENTRQALAQAQIALAEAAYREGDATTMQTALNAVPDDLRDSNWNYLLEKSDTSIATLSSSSSVITHMAPHPKQPGVFAAVSYNGQVEFVVVRTGLRLLKFQAGFKQKFNSEFWTAFSPDGERLAIGRADGGIAIHSARDGKKLMEWDTDHIKGLQFSPDGRQLLERERDNDYFSLWDTATGQLLWKTSKRGRAVFNPSGQFILVAFDDKLKLLNPKDGSVLREVADVRGGANSIAIRLDGNRALVGQQNGFVRCVDLKEGRVLFETRVASRSVWAIAYTTDGSRFVTRTALSGNRPSLQVWDAESGKPLQTLLGGGIGSFYNFWISIHPLSGEFMSNGSPIKVWDVNGGQSAKWRFNSHNGTRNVAFWRTDDMVFVNRFGDDSTRVLDLNLKEPLDQPLWRGESKKLHNVSVSADGRFAVVGRQQPVQVNFLRLNGSSVEQVYTPNLKNQIIHALALSPAGDRLWLNDSVIDPSTGAELLCVNSDEIKRFNCARWLNNTQVVTAVNAKAQRGRPNSEEQLILWDATTGQRLRSVTYPSYIFALAVAPDGKTFAEAGGDKMVRLRDAATLEVLDEFRAHDDAITALAFHPNRPILATGSADLTIKLWDLDTGRQLDELHGHTAPLQDVAFSPSGRRLASLSANDRATRIWEPESLNPDAAKAKVSADGWEDLLAQLKRDDVAKTGNGWQFNNGALFSPNRRNATIALPGKFAQSSYQVRVKLRQLTPKESLHILLPVADHQTSFMLDGYPQEGYWSCLHIIKGVNEKSQPETVKGKVVKDSELHELELTVQLEGSNVQFRAFLDDEPLYQWSGPADSLIQQEAWQITPPDVIALGAHNANWLVYAVKVKRLEK
jgi:WD40 repeat protein